MVCTLLVPSVQGGPPRALPKLPVFEGRAIALTAEQSAALARGEPAVQVLNTKDGRVVAVFGIVAIKGARKAFVNRLTNFPQSLRAQGIQSFGVFRIPTTGANVGTFTIGANDASSLRKCRTGKCEFKVRRLRQGWRPRERCVRGAPGRLSLPHAECAGTATVPSAIPA
jgi:hypothetical protein